MFGPPSYGTQDLVCSELRRGEPERADALYHGGVNKAGLRFSYRYRNLAPSGKIAKAIEVNRLESFGGRVSGPAPGTSQSGD